jgi:tRNA(Ile2) C34 agmatinyltransferase TiaS
MPSVFPVVKTCPACGSHRTAILPLTRLGRLFSAGNLRTWRCADCARQFRAADRRRFPRDGQTDRTILRG